MAAMQLDRATKMAMLTEDEVVQRTMLWGFRDILLLLKVLRSKFGKEEAKRLFSEARYNFYYQSGREKAKELGNPRDIDSLVEAYGELINSNPLSEPLEVAEKGKNKAILRGASTCVVAEALRRIANGPALVAEYGADALEVFKAHCVHDAAWMVGFNPKVKVEMTKFIFDGDDCCEWVLEL